MPYLMINIWYLFYTTYRCLWCGLHHAPVQIGLDKLVHAAHIFVLDPGLDSRLHAVVVYGFTVVLSAFLHCAGSRPLVCLFIQHTVLLPDGCFLFLSLYLPVQTGLFVLLLSWSQRSAWLFLDLWPLSEFGGIYKGCRCCFVCPPIILFFLWCYRNQDLNHWNCKNVVIQSIKRPVVAFTWTVCVLFTLSAFTNGTYL